LVARLSGHEVYQKVNLSTGSKEKRPDPD
jgi:hypothetical protein